MRYLSLFLILCVLGVHSRGECQKKKQKVVVQKNQPEERFTLLYKPQLGYLNYDVESKIKHRIEGQTPSSVISRGQTAMNNTFIDLDSGKWTFTRYFISLKTTVSKPMGGGDTTIDEYGAINKEVVSVYSMVGQELEKLILKPLKLSKEAQFSSYFFQTPRMLIPLPTDSVGFPTAIGYGYTWSDTRPDTLKIGESKYIYQLTRTYTFEDLADTLDGVCARIRGKQTGTLSGYQVSEGDTVELAGNITGEEVTYLNLYLGKVVHQSSRVSIPAEVRRPGDETPLAVDDIAVETNILINEEIDKDVAPTFGTPKQE